MYKLFMFLLIINTMIFSQTNHPMSMGFMLLIQTILISFLTGMMTKSLWFSYILFLIFIGGMLILFIYMASLASNEKFFLSYKFLIFGLIIFISYYFFFLKLDNFYFNPIFFNNDMLNFSNKILLIKENFLLISKLYDFPNNWLIIFLINYLLLNLIIVSKISNIFKGPLRSKK